MNKNIFKLNNHVYSIDEKIECIKDGDVVYNPNYKTFTVFYLGTMKQWESIKKEGSILDVPCIKCKDGIYIQKL